MSSLRTLREATVLEHMEAENAHDFTRCIAAFSHPRYEIVATGEVWDGSSGVNTLLNETRRDFPTSTSNPRLGPRLGNSVSREIQIPEAERLRLLSITRSWSAKR